MSNMRKNNWLFLLTLLLLLPCAALAEGEAAPGEFFDWTTLATFAGATAFVTFFVQYVKLPLDKVWKIPTRAVVYAVSLGVLLLAQGFLPGGGLTWESAALCVLNAALVALAAMQLYETAIREKEKQSPAATPETEMKE